ncbi:MAG: site-specific tyrosine recombinase XerD [Sphingobacteriales bacterium]|jgi:integrase/recombinase XerD|nr:site-specific tyrosine recombinase XerD [Sphingobacteriales bacterium]
MDWNFLILEFKNFLKLEKNASRHTIDAYLNDIQKLHVFCDFQNPKLTVLNLSRNNIEDFFAYLIDNFSIQESTQARILSGLKTFFNFLVYQNYTNQNAAELIDAPKLIRKLPDTLSFEEIEKLLESIDVSTEGGTRDRAILEVLYSCGLRITELLNLKLSEIQLDVEIVKVIGKGNKERIVPIGSDAIKYLKIYLDNYRKKKSVAEEHKDFVFLNLKGTPLSRISVFNMIKKQASLIGLRKNISPHTFRHSFATHLVEGGADLRAVQEMLGHVSITTTEIYTHLDNQFLRKTIELYHPLYKKE